MLTILNATLFVWFGGFSINRRICSQRDRDRKFQIQRPSPRPPPPAIPPPFIGGGSDEDKTADDVPMFFSFVQICIGRDNPSYLEQEQPRARGDVIVAVLLS